MQVTTPYRAAQEITTAEKQALALDMRRKHFTLKQIGEQLGCSHTYALRLVQNALKELSEQIRESAEQYRSLQTLRLEELLNAWEANALSGKDDKAAGVYLRTLDQLSKLYGLYPSADTAHAQGGVTVNVTYTHDQRQITIGKDSAHALPQVDTLYLDSATHADSTGTEDG